MTTKTSEELSFIEQMRRAQIIQAAIAVIAREGFAKASLVRIGKEAKISPGVISYHFAGKAELIMEVIKTLYSEGVAFMQPRIESQTNATAMIRAYIESNLAFMRAYPTHLYVLMEIGIHFRTDAGDMPYNQEELDQVLAVPKWILEWGQSTGEFRTFSSYTMAITLRAAIDAVPPRFAANPDLDLEAYAQELVTIFEKATRKED